MIKTILYRNGYKIKKKELSIKELKEIKKDLTVNPFVIGDFGNGAEKRFSLYMESPNSLYIPRFYGRDKFGEPTINKMEEGESIHLKFDGNFRSEQEPIINLYQQACEDKGGGLISLKCGGCKTVLALYIIAMLQKKTIVIVHKDFLMTQWRDRIQQFLPEARIGKIQQNTIDIENKDIVLAMVQSLSQKEYDSKVFSSFGLAIFDECHHLGAEVFSKSMSKVASKYMLGLSATPKRKDGLSRVFEWYMNDIVYFQKEKNKDYAEVQLIECKFQDEKYNKVEVNFRKEPCMPKMINNICNYYPRTQLIVETVKKYHDEKRSILILSDRRDHLNLLAVMIQDFSPTGFYVGGMKPDELRDSQEKDIILATFSMASEGMDIPKLNTVFLASPKSDVEQSVGRIFRQKVCDRSFHPLIVDIQDKYSMFEKQCEKRISLYHKSNYTLFKDGEEIKKKKRKKKEKIVDFALIDSD